MKEILEFPKEWLVLQKYQFKLLTAVTVLADNQKAYRGKLSDLCQYLSIQPSTPNINKLKSTIAFLAENNYVNTIVDKDIYTISLSKAAETNKNIIKIKRAWCNLIRNAKSEAAWEQVLKVFLVLMELSHNPDQIITCAEIGEMIKCSGPTVGRAVKTLCSIDFKDFRFQKEIITKRVEGDSYITLGTIYSRGIYFE